MDFRIADTFTDSLARLTNEEQKAVKTTAFDLQMDPASPGMRFHKLDKAKDKKFWSVRVGSDVRLIVHRTAGSLLLCYVDHHDKAYDWAERRKIERHPKTGAAQLVEVRERVQEVVVPTYVEEVAKPKPPKPPLFAHVADDDLLSYGVPAEWLGDVKRASEDTLFDLADHLPREASDALLDLATGNTPAKPTIVPPHQDPFEHPDARQRFRIMTSVEELSRALDAPWEKWAVFLHPAQQMLVERKFAGPARVAGSAGTGKTIVALHRAAHLARANPSARVLVTTFSDTLASMLRGKLHVLLINEPDVEQRINIDAINSIGLKLYEAEFGTPRIADDRVVREVLKEAAGRVQGHRFSERFLRTEWDDVVDAWQLKDWDEYRKVSRLGRKTRLGEKQREALWQILERAKAELDRRGLLTMTAIFDKLAARTRKGDKPAFDHIVVDEAQDISVGQLRFLAAQAGSKQNGLFFAGDLGQRIFQAPYSWKSLGVDVRGRSQTLRINYRTSHQIRRHADRLLSTVVTDVDGITDERNRTVSVFNGPDPTIVIADDEQAEVEVVRSWLQQRQSEGVRPHEIGLFVRSDAQIARALMAVKKAGMKPTELHEQPSAFDHVCLTTMHAAKGLEFRSVAVMACDDEVIPSQERVESVADESDLEEVYNTERHLLYVACTRARDHLLITAVAPGSEFLDDLRPPRNQSLK